MPLETGSYISDLVPTNPAGTDQRRQGDDHLRLVKSVLQTTFPSLDGAVTATPADLNKTSDLTNYFPSGGIIMWAGLIANIPTGWALCNGTGTAGGIAIPDMRNRFIIGADSDVGGIDDVGDIGGSRNIDYSGFSSAGHALTIAQMPSHEHPILLNVNGHNDGSASSQAVTTYPEITSYVQMDSPQKAGPVGSNSTHSHTLSKPSGTGSNLPSYYSLAFIIKL